MVSISKDNVRIAVTLSKDTHRKLKEVADKQSRSLSNLCAVIIAEYLEKHK